MFSTVVSFIPREVVVQKSPYHRLVQSQGDLSAISAQGTGLGEGTVRERGRETPTNGNVPAPRARPPHGTQLVVFYYYMACVCELRL